MLTVLEREGLVQPIAYRGYLVRPVEPGDVNDVYFMRRLLEGPGAELAATRITGEALALVAAWLAGIIVNLLLIPGHYDIALRDFGLFVAAIALSRLAVVDETTDRHLIH